MGWLLSRPFQPSSATPARGQGPLASAWALVPRVVAATNLQQMSPPKAAVGGTSRIPLPKPGVQQCEQKALEMPGRRQVALGADSCRMQPSPPSAPLVPLLPRSPLQVRKCSLCNHNPSPSPSPCCPHQGDALMQEIQSPPWSSFTGALPPEAEVTHIPRMPPCSQEHAPLFPCCSWPLVLSLGSCPAICFSPSK